MMKRIFALFGLLVAFAANPAYAEDPIYTGIFSSTAIDGHDTVAYFTEGKPVKGKDEFKAEWRGATWKFSSAENLAKFQASPEKFAPQYGGYCAWAAAQGSLAPGAADQWHIENGKLYLNYDASIKEKWLPERAKFIPQANEKYPGLVEFDGVSNDVVVK